MICFQDENDETPLHLAMRLGDIHIVKFLLKRKMVMNFGKDGTEKHAIGIRNVSDEELTLGVHPDALLMDITQNEDGDHISVLMPVPQELVRATRLSYKTRRPITSFFGQRLPADWQQQIARFNPMTSSHQRSKTAPSGGAMLVAASENDDAPKYITVTYDDSNLKERLNVNLKNNNGDTPLLWAVKYNREVAEMLVKVEKNREYFQKLDANVQDKNGNTPLHLAIMKGDNKLARLLIKRSPGNTFSEMIDINKQNSSGKHTNLKPKHIFHQSVLIQNLIYKLMLLHIVFAYILHVCCILCISCILFRTNNHAHSDFVRQPWNRNRYRRSRPCI